MKFGFAFSIAFLLASSAFAQKSTEVASAAIMSNGRQSTVTLVGRVVAEGDSGLPERAEVILDCNSDARSRASADAKGNFSMMLAVTESDIMRSPSPRKESTVSSEEWPSCELYSELPGYISERVRLFGNSPNNMLQVGDILLHPTSQDHSFAVSVTSLAAPEKAKQAFAKGQEQERKGKWSAAVECFKKAIAAYPRYALAWLEMGRAQVKQNSFTDARESFRQSVSQDSRLPDGYAELAHLALQQQQWKELAETSDHLTQIAPSAAEYWFLNSAANFNLGNVKQAETSIVKGMHFDPQHQIPQMEYLYGLILARKQDYQSAAEHVATYLRLSPHANDIEAAQKSLARIQQQAQIANR